MRERIAVALVLTGLLACAAGCRKEVDRAGFISAIDESYAGRHVCVWPEPMKLPVESDPSKDERTRAYNALTDAGLLIREAEVKEHFVPGTVPMNKYNLSDRGHAAWTADASRPDYGNFCFGHFNVTAIDKATANDPSNPTQYTVIYSYEVEGIPGWARTPESMGAFPQIAEDTSIQTGTATLVKGANGGWAVVAGQAAR